MQPEVTVVVVRNYYLLAGTIITILALLPLIFYVIPKQLKEVNRPKSELTPTRISLFLLESAIAVTMLPGVPRMIQLLSIPPSNDYAKVVAVTNKLPYLIISIILLVIYHQRVD